MCGPRCHTVANRRLHIPCVLLRCERAHTHDAHGVVCAVISAPVHQITPSLALFDFLFCGITPVPRSEGARAIFLLVSLPENTDGAPDRAGRTSSLSRDGHSTADPGRRCISMAQDRGTRRALLKPHTLFCGCCCSLKSGVLTGCSLFIMMYGTALITESFSARRSPDPALAQSFCELEDLEYRAAYNACYGMADVCVCDGGSPCVFHKAERQVELAAV